jgi:hypothetical protein
MNNLATFADVAPNPFQLTRPVQRASESLEISPVHQASAAISPVHQASAEISPVHQASAEISPVQQASTELVSPESTTAKQILGNLPELPAPKEQL